MATPSSSSKVTLLVLGAGWTYQFLQPLLTSEKISHAATTTTGHDDSIAFRFDPDSDDLTQYSTLPEAEFVLITFPLKGRGPSAKLLSMYQKTHDHNSATPTEMSKERGPKWIQLGSTGIYTAPEWNDESSPINETNERAVAEAELIELGGVVLNLAGLYGGARTPRNWLSRVAKTKEQLAEKGALHLIHGKDVARAVIAVIKNELAGAGGRKAAIFGKRWIIADGLSYDWWALAWEWSGESQEEGGAEDDVGKVEEKLKYRRWVRELMDENRIRGLPRAPELLGRKMDSRAFWKAVGLLPERTLAR